jgi:hypothetical protein
MKAQGWAPPLAAGTIGGKSHTNAPPYFLGVFVRDFPPIAQPGRAGLPILRSSGTFATLHVLHGEID